MVLNHWYYFYPIIEEVLFFGKAVNHIKMKKTLTRQKSLLLPLFLFLFLFLFFRLPADAGPGDTVIVQTIDFNTPVNPGWNAPREGKYQFPPDTVSFSKILMYYTLKCDPGQNPACGEWDYTTHTYYLHHTGEYDSNLYSQYNFIVNGATPDTFHFMDNTSWLYEPYFEYSNLTPPLQTVTLGSGSTSMALTNAISPDSRHQYLYLSSELTGAGLQAGEITGLQLNFQSGGAYLKKLLVRMKSTDSTVITPWNQPGDDGFITVFNRSTGLGTSGWTTIPFAFPFQWDGTSSVIVDISYENHYGDDQYILFADDPGFNSGIVSDQKDCFLDYEGTDHVEIPVDAFANLDSAITVSFWQYGDPSIQPQSDYLFEAVDQYNRRVLNVHLPWGDSKVYWDAGRDDDGYDRIHRTSLPEEYKGKWNHWAFVKDCSVGEMAVYLNGELWNYALGRYKLMDSIARFHIGSSAGNTGHYDGRIDEFRVWNTNLDQQSIADWMYRDVDDTHPHYSNLLAYYKFDEGEGLVASENSNGTDGHLRGYPQWMGYKGKGRMRNFVQQNNRPQVRFESGNYSPAALDSLVMVDTIPKGQLMIVMYEDTLNPVVPSDTLSKWPTYYNNYVYDPNGTATDSAYVTPDGTLVRDTLWYYGEPYEIIVKYELGRFITPYGINLDLGDGWTWIYDVTDFRPFLADTVHLQAGNFQELLDLKFYMIEGTPPREVKNIQRMWHGYHPLSNFEALVPPDTVTLDPEADGWKLKITTSGHDWDNSTNCAEFCEKTHWVDVDGSTEFTWEIIDECADNPLYPQGGTWIYDRAGWCPGDKVTERHLEITGLVNSGSVVLDYNCDPDPYGRYLLTSYLFEYGPPSFSLDARVDEILAPNKDEIYSRVNPMCGSPVVVICNSGSTVLTGLDIEYGPEGGVMQAYQWTGSLEFMDTAHVELPPIDWTDWSTGNESFHVTVSNPNGGQDEYELNNSATSHFELAPEYPNEFIIRFKSNKRPWENHWQIVDTDGNVVLERDDFEPDTEYRDTVLLDDGCYTFTMYDSGNDGISFWAHGFQGNGYLSFRRPDNSTLHVFTGDFGAWTSVNFTVGLAVNTNDLEMSDYVEVYPNPATDFLNISFALMRQSDVSIGLYDNTGKILRSGRYKGVDNETIRINTGDLSPGLYICRINVGNGSIHRKVIIR